DANPLAGEEGTLSVDQLDPVALDVLPNSPSGGDDDLGGPTGQSVEGDRRIELQTEAVHLAVLEAGHVQRRLPEGLGGNTCCAHHHAPGLGRSLDDGHPLAEVRGLRRALFAGRARADHDQVESIVASLWSDRWPAFLAQYVSRRGRDDRFDAGCQFRVQSYERVCLQLSERQGTKTERDTPESSTGPPRMTT